ncbi:MAG TPA: transglycosylase SLT domain-containing protein [Macromonas sp.]|nr:transglycosylase SLT domain-containing protein [Macromonas sp.]
MAADLSERALLDMRQAFLKNNPVPLRSLLPVVQGHPLEPLAAYWELKARLDTASQDEIQAFLLRYAGTYYEDRLRNDWLLLLGKNRDWPTFRRELPLYRMNDDREVQCYALLAERERLQPGSEAARQQVAQVRDLWLAQRRPDEGCNSAAAQFLSSRAMGNDVAWQRARWAMEYSQPGVATQAVGLLDTDWVPPVKTLYDNPAKYLDHKVTALRTHTKEFVTLALVRLASTDPQAARAQMAKLRWKAQLTTEERSWIWGVIGKRLAQKLSDEALDAFGHTRDAYLSDDHLAWKTRAALRAGEWEIVATSIHAMSEKARKEAVWTYWLARALQARGSTDAASQAKALLQRIAGTGGFYEQLALEALNQAVEAPPAPAPLTAEEKAQASQNPGLQRALQAIELGLRSEGVREWNYTVALHHPGGMTERELLAAANLACQHEVWDRCINTSARTTTEIDHAQRYPMPYRDQVVTRSRAIGLDPAYVYGLIRQESRFVASAASHVGASGLMQVMPATARWTAKRIGLKDFDPAQLTDREINVTIGTAYLKLALDDFEGSMPMAAAAYNAGPNRPRAWRNGPRLEAAVWIENIPFEETRDYVKNVLANTTNYAAILSGQPQKPSARLPPVGPRATTEPPSNTDLP